jgi:ferredoxin-fold anticodon binding domain-containing protein
MKLIKMSSKQPILYSGIHTFEHTNVEVETCMCGSEPVVGDNFYYKSKYSDRVLVGIVKQIRPSDIISMNGTSYSKSEITIKPVDVKRNEVLDKLGI